LGLAHLPIPESPTSRTGKKKKQEKRNATPRKKTRSRKKSERRKKGAKKKKKGDLQGIFILLASLLCKWG
jgi:hypothetical protein